MDRELCKYVHPLLSADEIVNVYVEHNYCFKADFLKYAFS